MTNGSSKINSKRNLRETDRKAILAYNRACAASDPIQRIELFTEALRFNDNFFEARYNLALVLFQLKSPLAVKELERTLVVIKRRADNKDLHEEVARTYLTACFSLSAKTFSSVNLALLPKGKSQARCLAVFAAGLYWGDKYFHFLSPELVDTLSSEFELTAMQLVLDAKIVLELKQRNWIKEHLDSLNGLFMKFPVSASRFLRRNLFRKRALEIIEPFATLPGANFYQVSEYLHAAIDILPFDACEDILARLGEVCDREAKSIADQSLFTSLCFWYQQQDVDDLRVWSLLREKDAIIPKISETTTNSESTLLKNASIQSIGFLSSDFRRHSVAYFMLELVRWLVRSGYRVVLFHGIPDTDCITDLFRSSGAQLLECAELDGDEAVSKIQGFNLDCVIDLNGWTPGTALHLFRNRLATIQGLYLGWGVTSGYQGVDFKVTDDWVDPPGNHSEFYTEALLRLGSCFLNYSPIDLKKAPRRSRVLDKNNVRFCSTNHPRKFNSLILELWGQLLGRIPGATLTLKHNDFKDVRVIKRMKAYLLNGGCSEEQLRFIPRIEGGSHLDFYDEFDFLLDTFPYTGTTTTMEALWSGCPVLTIEGDVHRARVTSSILRELDLGQCIFTPSSFVGGVIDLLNDFDGKIFMDHAELQAAIKASPLGDVEKFGPNFIKVLNEFFIKKVSVD